MTDPRLRLVPDEEWGQRIMDDESNGAMVMAVILLAAGNMVIGVAVGLLLGWWLL